MALLADAAECVLEEFRRLQGKADADVPVWRLHKLLYLSHAWHLVWDGVPLFSDPIQAWCGGPAIPALRERLGDAQETDSARGDADALTEDERESIMAVVEHYGKFTAQELKDIVCIGPWRDARKGLHPKERGTRTISAAMITAHYGSLTDLTARPSPDGP